jgi:hypothetical protein
MAQFAAADTRDAPLFYYRRSYRQRTSSEEVRDHVKREIQESLNKSCALRVEPVFYSRLEELRLAASVSDDWDSYGAPAPTRDSVDRTRRLLEHMKNRQFLPTTIVPSAEGGIAAYFISGTRTAYVEYRNSGETVIAMYDAVGEPAIKELRPDENDLDSLEAVRSYLA